MMGHGRITLYRAIELLKEGAEEELELQKATKANKDTFLSKERLVAFQEGAVHAYKNALAAFKSRGLHKD